MGVNYPTEKSKEITAPAKTVRHTRQLNQVTHETQTTHQETVSPSSQLYTSKISTAFESHLKKETFSGVVTNVLPLRYVTFTSERINTN